MTYAEVVRWRRMGEEGAIPGLTTHLKPHPGAHSASAVLIAFSPRLLLHGAAPLRGARAIFPGFAGYFAVFWPAARSIDVLLQVRMTRVSSAPRAPLKQTVQRRLGRFGARLFPRLANVAPSPPLAAARARLHGVGSAAIRVLVHPALLVLGLSICLAFLMRAAFFRNAVWLWQFALPLNLRDITPWARWAMLDRDGAEPYALLGAVIAQWFGHWSGAGAAYLAPGFIQPVHLVVLKYPLVDEMSAWLHAGYKIFVPRRADWVGSTFWEFAAHLPKLDATPTEHFTVYSLPH